MNKYLKTALSVVAVVALAVPAVAYNGNVVGDPAALAGDLPTCDPPLLDAANGDLYVLRSQQPSDLLYHLSLPGAPDPELGGSWTGTNQYLFLSDNWQSTFPDPDPTNGGNNETVWVIVTAYPNQAPGGTHEGWVLIDSTCAINQNMNLATCDPNSAQEPNVMQRLRLPQGTANAAVGGNPGDISRGFDVSFEYPTEIGGSVSGTAIPTCQIGGNFGPSGSPEMNFDARAIIGFNVYRINVTAGGPDAATSTPLDYLCGPGGADGDCTDGNWAGFIPLDPSVAGLTVDDPNVNTNDPTTYPAGVADRGGATTVIFSDQTCGAPLDQPCTTDTFTYAYQPVVKGAIGGGTWNGLPARDVNGDGVPEFIDPSGQGLGLTFRGDILISGDVVVDGANTTPIEGSLNFNAVSRARLDGIDLSFLSSVEGDVIGYNIYRSFDGGTSYHQVNGNLLAADGNSLNQYSYTDNFNLRRLRTKELHYKVGVVLADGSAANFGPYTVAVPRIQNEGSRTRRR